MFFLFILGCSIASLNLFRIRKRLCMYIALIIFVTILMCFLLYTHRVLGGENLSRYDQDLPITFDMSENTQGLNRLNDYLRETFNIRGQSATTNSGWSAKRERFDAAGLARDYDCEFRTDNFKSDSFSHDGINIDGDWTILEGADPAKRILYLHGGAFTVGSAISHRPITYNLAKQTGCVVFAPNYRLMPENPRRASIEDCRAAYRWILDNGPVGAQTAKAIGVSGDSAGGNLALMVSQWARHSKLRKPDAVVALSPITDATLSSPSMKKNLDTDLILKSFLKPVLKAPRSLLLWGLKKVYGFNPSDPLISPIYDDLSGLAPTLIQASATEMLFDDSVRYAAKAQSQGSPVVFQSWTNLPHVWQIFDTYVSEAHHALDEIGAFFKRHGVYK